MHGNNGTASRRNCDCGKVAFKSRKRAVRMKHRVGAERVYWCAEAGGYHVTRYTRAEITARFALRRSAAA